MSLSDEDIEWIAKEVAAAIMRALRDADGPRTTTTKPKAEEKQTYIYALCEPGTDVVRYVGQSVDPEDRFVQHLYEVMYKPLRIDETPKQQWIRRLLSEGKEPTLKVLERVPHADAWRHERRWIAWAKGKGFSLTNIARPA